MYDFFAPSELWSGVFVCAIKEVVNSVKRLQDNLSRSRTQTKEEIRYLPRELKVIRLPDHYCTRNSCHSKARCPTLALLTDPLL